MLRSAHALIAADREMCGDDAAPVVHLGDFCDRGPDTAGVIRFLRAGIDAAEPWRAVLGNHDRLFRNFLTDAVTSDPRLRAGLNWLSSNMGGRETLRSYKIEVENVDFADLVLKETATKVPAADLDFLRGLESYIETEYLVFVHAGIVPGIPLDQQLEDDLVWMREPFLTDTRDHGKLIVHGHTPVDTATHYGNRVNLDTGAGYFQPLTAAVFEDRECWILTASGRAPLHPQPKF